VFGPPAGEALPVQQHAQPARRKAHPGLLRETTNRIMDAVTDLLADIRGEQPPAVRFDPRAAGVREIGNPNGDAERPRHGRPGRQQRRHDRNGEGKGA